MKVKEEAKRNPRVWEQCTTNLGVNCQVHGRVTKSVSDGIAWLTARSVCTNTSTLKNLMFQGVGESGDSLLKTALLGALRS